VALLEQGLNVVVLDDLSNAKQSVLHRIEAITDRPCPFIEGDIRDRSALDRLFTDHHIQTVIHFAGLKAVGESVADPLRYYDVNVGGTMTLLKAMIAANVTDLVFSSSATVYGTPQFLPYTEDHPLNALNPYGQTKLIIENMLRDLSAAEPAWRIRILRYFNPCGAHPSGQIGEDPKGVPNNLVPFMAQVAAGRRETLQIWGGDYETSDGTGVRDYIHVMDLAEGHVRALHHLRSAGGCKSYNLGAGKGYSVLDVHAAFEAASGQKIPYRIVDRRPGDLPAYYADPTKAEMEFDWKATRTLDDICRDHWRWQSKNPDGYPGR
jgi:UDP-glucose 4-epimerase